MQNMPENNNTKVMYRTVLIFAVCIAVILLIAQIDPIMGAIKWVSDFMMPVFIGVVLAYIVNPFTVWLERRVYNAFKIKKECSRCRFARGVAVTFSVIALLAVISLLIFLIIPEFLDNLYKLIDSAPELIQKGVTWFEDAQNSDNTFMQNIGNYVDSLLDTLINWISGGLGDAIAVVFEKLVSVVNFMFDFLIALVIFVYALLEKRKFVAQSKKLVFALFSKSLANDILNVARYGNEVFGKFISGKLITSTIVGILTFVFMSIMGMPYALLSAGIIAITNIIPFFGPFIGGIPTAFIVLITDLRHGIIYVIFLVLLQQIEGNIIEPMIMEDKTGLSKFWITFALLLCGGVFGVAGMIFSVPLFAVLFYSLKIAVERSLSKKQLPISSDFYGDAGGVDLKTNVIFPSPGKKPHKRFDQAVKEWKSRVRGTEEENPTEPIVKDEKDSNNK